MLITSNFSFSHIVFKRPELQTCKNPGLVWERFNIFGLILTFTCCKAIKELKRVLVGFNSSPNNAKILMCQKRMLLKTSNQEQILSFWPLLMTLKKRAFENIVGKGENAGSPFLTMFSTHPIKYFCF